MSFPVEFVFHKMAAIKLVHVQVACSLNREKFLRHFNDKKSIFLVKILSCRWPAPNLSEHNFVSPSFFRRNTEEKSLKRKTEVLSTTPLFRAGQGLMWYLIQLYIRCLKPSYRGSCFRSTFFFSRFFIFFLILWEQIRKLKSTTSLKRKKVEIR